MHRVKQPPASTLAAFLLTAGALVQAAHAQETPSSAPEQEAAPAEAYSREGADSCIKCHDSAEVLSLFKTKHGSRAAPDSPFASGQLQCESCHGPGGTHAARVRSGQPRPPIPNFGFNSISSVASQNQACLGCHADNLQHAWRDATHDRNEVACADCHQIHSVHDAVRSTRDQAEVCFDCHQQQRADHLKAFRHPVAGNLMSCSSCHSPHGSPAEFDLRRSSLNETCYACHAEKRGPYLWEHAPVTEDCSNCHEPHGSSQPALLRVRAPLLCQQCHSQAGHPTFAYGPDNLPGGSQPSSYLAAGSCLNCHSQVHGSNHPSGSRLTR
jgi:DmsE family decaheme c-type cytochrome